MCTSILVHIYEIFLKYTKYSGLILGPYQVQFLCDQVAAWGSGCFRPVWRFSCPPPGFLHVLWFPSSSKQKNVSWQIDYTKLFLDVNVCAWDSSPLQGTMHRVYSHLVLSILVTASVFTAILTRIMCFIEDQCDSFIPV